eukprot:6460526-Amphidinium_carterae.1
MEPRQVEQSTESSGLEYCSGGCVWGFEADAHASAAYQPWRRSAKSTRVPMAESPAGEKVLGTGYNGAPFASNFTYKCVPLCGATCLRAGMLTSMSVVPAKHELREFCSLH